MDSFLGFLATNTDIAFSAATLLIGIFIPKEKVFGVGKTVGSKLPKKTAKFLADYLDNLENGLRESTVEGDETIVSNEQVSNAMEKAKIDLGLKG
jgi:hypothetical protein